MPHLGYLEGIWAIADVGKGLCQEKAIKWRMAGARRQPKTERQTRAKVTMSLLTKKYYHWSLLMKRRPSHRE